MNLVPVIVSASLLFDFEFIISLRLLYSKEHMIPSPYRVS